MSIGENTLLLKRGCLNCNGFDFCGGLCINCAKPAETTLPISIKACQNSQQQKAASSHFSLSSSLTVASPPPIFMLLEEEQSKFDGSFKVQQSASNFMSPGQMAINDHLFKEYRDASSTAGLSSSTFESEVSDGEQEEEDDEDEDDTDSESDFSSDSDYPRSWCFEDFFAQLPGNDWCVRIPASFIHDEFNLFEFPDVFRCPLRLTDEPKLAEKRYTDDYGFDDLLELITTDDLEYSPDGLPEGMLMDAVLLYKLIHQRYILTKQGIQEMCDKYDAAVFGTCPRILCNSQALLPVGPSALPAVAACKVYCLNCQDLYTPASRAHAQSDGVAFGPTFAHFLTRNVLFLEERQALWEREKQPWRQFVPKIYGFKIAERQGSSIRFEAPRDYK